MAKIGWRPTGRVALLLAAEVRIKVGGLGKTKVNRPPPPGVELPDRINLWTGTRGCTGRGIRSHSLASYLHLGFIKGAGQTISNKLLEIAFLIVIRLNYF